MVTDVVRNTLPLRVNYCASFGAQKVENEVKHSALWLWTPAGDLGLFCCATYIAESWGSGAEQ